MIAPASLKPWDRDEDGYSARGATPGHDCPGLIEASRGPSHSRSACLPLRGMIAPASLKPSLRTRTYDMAISPLRGMIAPASLKLENYLWYDPGNHHHSGA